MGTGKAKVEFESKQQEAVQTALSHKITLITGGPGTGKTTILRAVVDILSAKIKDCLGFADRSCCTKTL